MLGRRSGVAAPFSAAVIAAGLLFASGLFASVASAAASDFSSYLAEGYRELAAKAGKGPAAQLYKTRSAASAAGKTLEPLQPGNALPDGLTLGEVQEARDKLMEALSSGGLQRQPLLAAIAQVNYDCWIAPLPKRKGAPRSIDCHSRFLLAFGGLPDKHRRGPISSVEPWQFAGSVALPDIHSAAPLAAGNSDAIGGLILALSAPSMPKRAAVFDAALAAVYDVGQTPLDNAVVGSCDTNCQNLEFSGPGTAPLIAALRSDKSFEGLGNSNSGQQSANAGGSAAGNGTSGSSGTATGGTGGSGPSNNGSSGGITGGSSGSGGSVGGSSGSGGSVGGTSGSGSPGSGSSSGSGVGSGSGDGSDNGDGGDGGPGSGNGNGHGHHGHGGP
jgi:hypothetical protein